MLNTIRDLRNSIIVDSNRIVDEVSQQNLDLRNELLALADDLRENVKEVNYNFNSPRFEENYLRTRNRLADIIENHFGCIVANDTRE